MKGAIRLVHRRALAICRPLGTAIEMNGWWLLNEQFAETSRTGTYFSLMARLSRCASYLAFKVTLAIIASVPVLMAMIKVHCLKQVHSLIKAADKDAESWPPTKAELCARAKAVALLEEGVEITPDVESKLAEILPTMLKAERGNSLQRSSITVLKRASFFDLKPFLTSFSKRASNTAIPRSNPIGLRSAMNG